MLEIQIVGNFDQKFIDLRLNLYFGVEKIVVIAFSFFVGAINLSLAFLGRYRPTDYA
jgi:hypothetical protein